MFRKKKDENETINMKTLLERIDELEKKFLSHSHAHPLHSDASPYPVLKYGDD